jgi:hypothetical protein
MSDGEITEDKPVVSNEVTNVSQGDMIAVFDVIIEAAKDPVGFVARDRDNEFEFVVPDSGRQVGSGRVSKE